LSQLFSTEQLYTDGNILNSIIDVMKRAQQSAYLRSKMETASAAIPKFNGLLKVFIKVIMMQCFLIFLAAVTSLPRIQVKMSVAVV
jgi:hypothetical protein